MASFGKWQHYLSYLLISKINNNFAQIFVSGVKSEKNGYLPMYYYYNHDNGEIMHSFFLVDKGISREYFSNALSICRVF